MIKPKRLAVAALLALVITLCSSKIGGITFVRFGWVTVSQTHTELEPFVPDKNSIQMNFGRACFEQTDIGTTYKGFPLSYHSVGGTSGCEGDYQNQQVNPLAFVASLLCWLVPLYLLLGLLRPRPRTASRPVTVAAKPVASGPATPRIKVNHYRLKSIALVLAVDTLVFLFASALTGLASYILENQVSTYTHGQLFSNVPVGRFVVELLAIVVMLGILAKFVYPKVVKNDPSLNQKVRRLVFVPAAIALAFGMKDIVSAVMSTPADRQIGIAPDISLAFVVVLFTYIIAIITAVAVLANHKK